MKKGSWNDWLMTFELGERRYVETLPDAKTYMHQMRTMNTPKSRRPPQLQNREFTTMLLTALATSSVDDIRYLICVERVK